MALIPGTRLGPYEILSAIGAGGMGEVYRARDTRLDRVVAIKVLPESLAADPQFRERFEREARAISQLTHPHICTLHDIGRQDLTDFLVMEYLEGETLADRLAKGALPLDQALTIAIQIASALDTAHRAGIVHRDLKPSNVMLTRSGGKSAAPIAKLLDFGLAKASAPAVVGAGLSMLPTTPPGLTAQGTILGTFHYMAPEQLEGQEADTRTDIFAFGAVLYEMLTGKKAFGGKGHASLIASIMSSDPKPISALQPLTPPALDRLVGICLAKDPDDRWQSAGDLVRELKWIAHAGTTIPSAAVAGAVTRGTRNSLLSLVTGAALLGAIALAWPATLYFRRAALEVPLTRLELSTPPTTDPFSFALSPDGRKIVFVAAAEGASTLWLRPLDQTTAQPLVGTEGATAPFWAADGRAIGFFADGKLKRADLTGGAPQVLADASRGFGGTWNSDGVIVFAGAADLTLKRVADGGGTATALTRLTPGEAIHVRPQFLPDGRRFLFYSAGTADTRGVYVGSLDGLEPKRVLPGESAAAYVPPGYLLLVSQGVLVARRFDAASGVVSGDLLPVAQSVGVTGSVNSPAFAVSTAGVLAHRSGAAARRQLVWVDRAGQPQGVLVPPEDAALAYVELAPNGRQVAVARSAQGNFDVWLIEVVRGLASRFTFDPSTDSSPLWSPDGSRLVFRSTRNGNYDLFEKPANGVTDEQPLLITPQDKAPQAWSPDGRFLLYTAQYANMQSDLWALPMAGERTPFPVVQTSFDEGQGQFSADGRWVAYASNESGRYEIYIRPFPGPGGKRQVSTDGGIYPRWRRDGKELFYVGLDKQMMAVPIQLSAGDRTVNPGAPVALFLSRLTTGNTGSVGFSSRAQYAVAPNGWFLLNVSAEDAAASPITIVQNWTAGLKKQ